MIHQPYKAHIVIRLVVFRPTFYTIVGIFMLLHEMSVDGTKSREQN